MKNLFLIRHAKSSWTDDSLHDIDRPLNKRGKRQVAAMAGPLLELGALGDPVYVSHACRARQTIEGLLEHLPEQDLVSGIRFEPTLYTFRAKHLFKWLRSLRSDASSVTLIGHNPALTDLADMLTDGEVPDMVTGAVLHLRLPLDHRRQLGKGKGTLVRYLPPAQASYRLYRRKAPDTPETGNSLHKQVPVSLRHQLDTIRALQPGVIQGIDPEFLHQFRVNLRRSRAVTEAVETISGESALRKGLKPLKRMARRTSQLRDLDVFLHYLDQQASDNPRLQRSLRSSGATDFYRHWREQERQSLSGELERKKWHRELTQWEQTITGKVLDRAVGETTPDAIHDTVRERGMLCLGLFRALSTDAPDEDFHEVRKALKRLRYLAELDKGYYRPLLRELKEQQALYGEFQDRHQQLWLLAELADSRMDRRLPPVMTELADQIDRERQAAREAILARAPRIDDQGQSDD
ncbi:CHAD domain-containing protein [Marinobacter sp. LN3S78]|uniref:CHAD domain-containing protein n=1 Tax=Marinobacter sp. LN3S78 TaxID=3382300 RepID=UPI00387AF42D